MIKEKGDIVEISKMFDEATMKHFWHIRVYIDDTPNLKMGKCEVTQ